MAPAEGERFRVIGKVLKSGRKITVCAGDAIAIDHGKEKTVATILATMMLVKK
jgi:acyl-coenzyme A thioesterase PaaI-like protein